jgi:hypothetical protein
VVPPGPSVGTEDVMEVVMAAADRAVVMSVISVRNR